MAIKSKLADWLESYIEDQMMEEGKCPSNLNVIIQMETQCKIRVHNGNQSYFLEKIRETKKKIMKRWRRREVIAEKWANEIYYGGKDREVKIKKAKGLIFRWFMNEGSIDLASKKQQKWMYAVIKEFCWMDALDPDQEIPVSMKKKILPFL